MKNNELSKDKKRFNSVANNISRMGILIYVLLLCIIEYAKNNKFSYSLFSIFFVSELIKAFYKYVKTKDNLYLLESIGCIISIAGLFILII